MMPLAMQVDSVNWSEFGMAGGAIFLVVALLVFLLKILPTFERIKSREFDIRTEEAKVTGQISTALLQSGNAQTQLAGAIESLGTTLNHIAVEQRKTTDNLIILQRSTASETDNMAETVDMLVERIDSMEEAIKENGIHVTIRPKAVASKRN